MPSTYDEWLLLSPHEKEAVKNRWNAYNREGIGFVHCAAGRLAISCGIKLGIKIFDIRAGTYHCGGWIIHIYINESDLSKVPSPLAQYFEGFRVYWISESVFDVRK